MGTLQAVEVVKELLQLGDSLVGRLLLYDALQTRFTMLDYAWDAENPLNGETPRFKDLSHHRATLAPAGG
jgi:adenylyltransferase/sulfurtransferase